MDARAEDASQADAEEARDADQVDAADAGVDQEDAALDGGEQEPLDHSGTRLRARRVYAGEQPVATLRVEDGLLDVPCVFRRAADGQTYCMPATGESQLSNPPAYLDAACTSVALVQSDACAAGPFHLLTSDACAPVTRAYRVQEMNVITWYSRDGDACVAHTLLPGQRVFGLSEEVPASQLVQMQSARLGSGQLQREVLRGADGSQFTRGAYDRSLGGCEPLFLSAPDEVRCVPLEKRAHHGGGVFYADAQCTAPVAYAFGARDACAAPTVVLQASESGPACQVGGRPWSLLAVGAAQAAAYEHADSGQCAVVPAASYPQLSFFQPGAALATQHLARTLPLVTGSGRIRAYVWGSEQAMPLAPIVSAEFEQTLLFDAQLQVRCEPVRVQSEWLCAPPRATVVYANPSCTTALLEVFDGAECPVTSPTLYSVRGTRSYECGQPGPHESLSLLRPGQSVPVPAHRYIEFQGSCVQADSPAIKARYFTLGAQLPADVLARLTVRRE